MYCDRVLGNLETDPPAAWAGRAVDPVDIAWHECGRLVRSQSRSGKAVRVLLPPGQRLRHRDVLADEGDGTLVAVDVTPCELIVVTPPDARAMATLALELGNLHWPAQVGERDLSFVEDGPAMAVVRRMGLQWERQTRRFAPLWAAGVTVGLAKGLTVSRR